jgi:hypothetical protein
MNPIEAAFQLPDLKLQAPAALLQARQGGLISSQRWPEAVQLQGMGVGLRGHAAVQAALDLGREQGSGGPVPRQAFAYRIELGLGVRQQSLALLKHLQQALGFGLTAGAGIERPQGPPKLQQAAFQCVD